MIGGGTLAWFLNKLRDKKKQRPGLWATIGAAIGAASGIGAEALSSGRGLGATINAMRDDIASGIETSGRMDNLMKGKVRALVDKEKGDLFNNAERHGALMAYEDIGRALGEQKGWADKLSVNEMYNKVWELLRDRGIYL